jgi:hypothetical protein
VPALTANIFTSATNKTKQGTPARPLSSQLNKLFYGFFINKSCNTYIGPMLLPAAKVMKITALNKASIKIIKLSCGVHSMHGAWCHAVCWLMW